jgi:hypothetical protein
VVIVALVTLLPSITHHHQPDPSAVVIAVAAGLACLLPMIFVSVNWIFTLPLIVDKRIEFWPAMQTSWKMVRKRWWQLFGLVLLVGVILIVLAVGGTAFVRSDQPSPSPEVVVRAAYSLTARLSTDDTAWTVDEKYTFGERAVDEVLNNRPPPSSAPEGGLTGMALASYLAAEFGDGWLPAVDTGDPVLQRSRTTSSRIVGLTTSTHVIDLPHLLAGDVVVVPDGDSTAILRAPRYTIVRTSPPQDSRDPLVGDGMEDVRLPILSDTPAIRLESADGPLRNELFFGLANVSFVSLTGLAVGGLVSSLTAAFGGSVWGSLKRLVGRREVPEG